MIRTPSGHKVYAIAAEYGSPEALYEAAKRVRDHDLLGNFHCVQPWVPSSRKYSSLRISNQRAYRIRMRGKNAVELRRQFRKFHRAANESVESGIAQQRERRRKPARRGPARAM